MNLKNYTTKNVKIADFIDFYNLHLLQHNIVSMVTNTLAKTQGIQNKMKRAKKVAQNI
jgi:hypothetical protein